jgi:UDP-3-O-[3-hydroxymyristoyl] glucosamine N-acyltransferase
LPDGAFVTGVPARPHREWLRANANLQRLDELRKRVKELEETIARLARADQGGGD